MTHFSYKSVRNQLLLLSAFCFSLQLFRMLFTLNLNYIFLPYNLLLAWIPLLFAQAFSKSGSRTKMFLLSAAWLLFLPNAPYIITDLLHLKPRDNWPFWFDVFLLYSFALTGLLTGIVSALLVYGKLKTTFKPITARAVLIASILLCGYGIYMGRYLRWNSWDALLNPLDILADTANRLLHPHIYLRTYGLTLLSSVLIWLVFKVFESLTQKEEA